MNGKFVAYVERCLAPTLERNDIVVIDNLPARKAAGVREAIEARGVTLRYLSGGKSDIAWRDLGNTAILSTNGIAVLSQNNSFLTSVSGQWAIVGQRDFNISFNIVEETG
jgi:hypothetical protein